MSQRIVEIIRKANLLNKEDLAKAVEFSTRDNIPFMLFLFSNNMVNEETVMPLLEQGLGVERIDLDSQDIEPAVLDCVPRDVAMQYRIIPINRLANNLIVAGGDPTDLALIDKISARLSSKVKIKLASELAITRAINKYYTNRVEAEKKSTKATSAEVSDTYVVAFIDRLLQTAAHRKASDIHIEPFETMIRIRLRADGTLQEYLERLIPVSKTYGDPETERWIDYSDLLEKTVNPYRK